MVGSETIACASSIKNLGVWFDSNLNFEKHITAKCKIVSYNLHCIGSIRSSLTSEACKLLVHGLVHSHIDYCNSIFFGISNHLITRLQRLQNYAARLVFRASAMAPSTPLRFQLHWLPVEFRIRFKICLLVFKSLNDMAPDYLTEMFHRKQNTRYSLRSDSPNCVNLAVPRTKCKTFGDRSFLVCGPRLWNELPPVVRLSSSLSVFKKNLKTYLFNIAFHDYM